MAPPRPSTARGFLCERSISSASIQRSPPRLAGWRSWPSTCAGPGTRGPTRSSSISTRRCSRSAAATRCCCCAASRGSGWSTRPTIRLSHPSGRGARRSAPLPARAGLVPVALPGAGRPARRLLLHGVRSDRLPAHLLGRPGRAGRRPPQGRERARPASGGGRAALQQGLLHPAAGRGGLAARGIPAARLQHPARHGRCMAGEAWRGAVRRRQWRRPRPAAPGSRRHRRLGDGRAAQDLARHRRAHRSGPRSGGCRWAAYALYLLDSALPENDPAGQRITNELYGGGTEERLAQELLLGIGGMRALQGPGRPPQVCHLNEGHSVFSSLERMRELMESEGLSFSRPARPPAPARSSPPTRRCRPASTCSRRRSSTSYLGDYLKELGLDTERVHAHGPGQPRRRPTRSSTWPCWPCASAAPQRRQPPAPPRHRRHDGAGLGGLPDARRCPSSRSPTGCTPRPGWLPRWSSSTTTTWAPLARGRPPPPTPGSGWSASPTWSCGARTRVCGSGWSRTPASRPRPRQRDRREGRRRSGRPPAPAPAARRPHHRFRPALRHLQAGHAALPRLGAAQGHPARRAAARCS